MVQLYACITLHTRLVFPVIQIGLILKKEEESMAAQQGGAAPGAAGMPGVPGR